MVCRIWLLGKENKLVQIDDVVTLKIVNDFGKFTFVTGQVESVGLVPNKPDAFWFQIVGLTSFFYSDDKGLEIKVEK